MDKNSVKTAGIPLAPLYRFMLASFFTVAISTMFMTDVYAGSGGLGDVLCNAAALVNGSLGRGLATTVIIMLGIGAMFGKVSWGLACIVGVGIAVLANAYTIAGLLVPGMAGVPCGD
jgi:type IV secretory pathway VirB2 component (pilin)